MEGLIAGNIEPMSWESVNGWAPLGGAVLGTKRSLPDGKFEEIAEQLRRHQVSILSMFYKQLSPLQIPKVQKN